MGQEDCRGRRVREGCAHLEDEQREKEEEEVEAEEGTWRARDRRREGGEEEEELGNNEDEDGNLGKEEWLVRVSRAMILSWHYDAEAHQPRCFLTIPSFVRWRFIPGYGSNARRYRLSGYDMDIP